MPLFRSIGRWTLTALVVNAIVGSSIFGLPSELTSLLGRASPIAMLVAAGIISIVIACMAEVASQFTTTGGPYLYALIQFVAVATIGTRPSEYPLADTASVLLRHGGLFVAVAVMMSTYGWLAGDILLSPRIVYSFAETGDAPTFLARIHPGFYTPALALFLYAGLTWMLAVTGTFLWVAAVAAASSLVLYCGVCASLIRLRKLNPKSDAFRVPFGPVFAVVAICISVALMSALDIRQVLLMSVTALLATANWWWAKHHEAQRRRRLSGVISATGASE